MEVEGELKGSSMLRDHFKQEGNTYGPSGNRVKAWSWSLFLFLAPPGAEGSAASPSSGSLGLQPKYIDHVSCGGLTSMAFTRHGKTYNKPSSLNTSARDKQLQNQN